MAQAYNHKVYKMADNVNTNQGAYNGATIEQVYNCLNNGNHKKQDSGNIPQGLHNIEQAKALFGADKIPQGLPDNAKAVFISNNNIMAYTTSAGLTINKVAQARATKIQAGALMFLVEQAKAQGKAVAYTDIAWQGKASGGTDKAQALASKVASMF